MDFTHNMSEELCPNNGGSVVNLLLYHRDLEVDENTEAL